jgi:hypothetical protein
MSVGVKRLDCVREKLWKIVTIFNIGYYWSGSWVTVPQAACMRCCVLESKVSTVSLFEASKQLNSDTPKVGVRMWRPLLM